MPTHGKDDKDFEPSLLLTQLEESIRGLRRLVELFDEYNVTKIGQIWPELPEGLFYLTGEIENISAWLEDHLYPRHRISEEAIKANPGLKIRSILPLPAGQGMQINTHNPHGKTHSDPGLNEEDARISVAIYLGTDDREISSRIFHSVDTIAQYLGYGDPENVETKRGSIFRKWTAKVKKAATSEEMRERLDKIERAIELQGLVLPQADADLKSAQAVSGLIKDLAEIPSACIRIGSLFLVKYQTSHGPVLLTRNLSVKEMQALERFPEIQKEPSKALELLAFTVSSSEEEQPPSLGSTHTN
ncbi:hypothetical protein [Amycolatopsis kentuckyensis]|uniref:hypothetical protein n=1 Tax=Amycolatopsis kentuckyensis TaxID=218823 RepID=UPI0011781475|nr:hypothetical protein [Amycolatopsis kentuckyensis]